MDKRAELDELRARRAAEEKVWSDFFGEPNPSHNVFFWANHEVNFFRPRYPLAAEGFRMAATQVFSPKAQNHDRRFAGVRSTKPCIALRESPRWCCTILE